MIPTFNTPDQHCSEGPSNCNKAKTSIKGKDRKVRNKLLQRVWASYLYPSKGGQNENHNHSKLTKLITWITAFCNSMKLWAMLCRATQEGWVTMESYGKMWSTGEGNEKSLQYSCLENPMNSMKRQKDATLGSGRCQILDLWRSFSFQTRDQPWSFRSFCVAEFY